MLDYKLEGNILEVIQSTFSFHKSVKQYWYYDIVNWKKSVNGQRNEKPRIQMTHTDIEWVKKFYLPKVGET
jgi:hypothetical protein